MATDHMDLGQSQVVHSVRKRCERNMCTIERRADYKLTDLAVAFPEGVRGYRCTIERASNRETVGRLEGDRGGKRDPMHAYCVVELSNGTKLEFLKKKANPDVTIILCNNSYFGSCTCTDKTAVLFVACEREWELQLGRAKFGQIRRGLLVTEDNLFISCPDGTRLPIILAYKNSIADFPVVLWRLLSLSFLFTPPPPNRDLIIPHEAGMGLSEKELVYYFAISLYFRAAVFQLEYE